MQRGSNRVVAGVALGLVAAAALGGVATAGSGPALVEAARCTRPQVVGPPRPAETVPGSTSVSFVVLPTVQLRLDGAGSVTAASTNTGCAPRAGDRYLVDGRPASSGEVADALRSFRVGDWRTVGHWHDAG